MATSKPIGDNARKGAVKKRSQLKNPLTKTLVEAEQEGRLVHGGQKDREEVQGRSTQK